MDHKGIKLFTYEKFTLDQFTPIAIYEKILEVKPDHFFAIGNLGIIFSQLKKFNEVLAKSVTAGGLQVSGYQSEKKTYLQKIDLMSKNIKVKVSKYNG